MKKHWEWLAGSAILAVGSYLRLTLLYTGTMGSDVMEFFKICQTGVSPAELMLNAPQHIGELPPLWFAAHNWFLQTFGLEATFGNVRLLDALTGILTLFAAFGAGHAAGGRRVGLLAALFVALQPLHVQLSRECYFYSAIVLGCFLALWAFIHLANRLDRHQAPGVAFYFLALPGFILLTYTQTSSWSFALVLIVALYTLLIPAVLRHQLPVRHLAGMTGGFFLAGLPLLFSSWGISYAFSLMFGERGAHWGTVFGAQERHLLATAGHILSAYLVGRGGFRTVATVLLLLAGGTAIAKGWKAERKLRVFVCFSIGAFALLALIHSKSIFPAENRHYSSLFPILTIGISLGLVRWAEHAATRWKATVPVFAQWPLAGPPILIAALLGWPAWLSSQQDFAPPFHAVSTWADTHLPAGSVVLCDRWFTPWNEFRINPSTNVTYTFTVPSEPLQTYTDSRWRETAKEFFANNPLAAFFEQKVFWTRLGPWTWPHTFFARKEVFEDVAAARLDAMGLYYRSRPLDYPRDWIPLTLYYNTEEDLVARARQVGQPLLCLFGPGWQYTKTQDYRDWYALRESATAVVHNLTDAPAQVFLDIAAVATPGAITLTAYAGTNAVFPANQLQTRRLGPIEIAPGRQEIRLANLTQKRPETVLLVKQVMAQSPQLVVAP